MLKFELFLIRYRKGYLRISKINPKLGYNTAQVLRYTDLSSMYNQIETFARSKPLAFIFSPTVTKRLKDYQRIDLDNDWRKLFTCDIDTQTQINFKTN